MVGPSERIRQIQEEITRQTGVPEEGLEEAVEVLLFSLAGEQFAMPLEHLREISRVGPITVLPGLPPPVLGATGLRGEVLPVLNLHRLLGLEEAGITDDSRLLVVQHEAVAAALLADRVADIATISKETLLPPPVAEETPTFLQGIAHEGQETTRLLDLTRLLEAVRHAR